MSYFPSSKGMEEISICKQQKLFIYKDNNHNKRVGKRGNLGM